MSSPPLDALDIVDVEDTDPVDPSSQAGVSSPKGSKNAQQQAPDGTYPGLGFLLEETDEKKVFQAIHKIVTKQSRLAQNRDEAAKHWGRIRRGIPFSILEKTQDRAIWKAKLPPGISDTQQPVPNKADDLCSKIVSTELVDPPMPKTVPQSDLDEHQGAAELAQRFLEQDGGESGTHDIRVFQIALDGSMTRSSMFVHIWVDPDGGGWRPKQIKAHPFAEDPSNPLVDAQGLPTTDYVLRYVTEDGQFTANALDAAMQWQPKIMADVLSQAQVRTVPPTADVSRAEKVILLLYAPLSTAKRLFPALAEMEDEEVAEVIAWRPPRHKALLSRALTATIKDQLTSANSMQEVPDDTLVFWYQAYCRTLPDYPEGASIAVNGAFGGFVLDREPWSTIIETIDPLATEGATGQTGDAQNASQPAAAVGGPSARLSLPNGGGGGPIAPSAEKEQRKLCLDIPVAQFKCLEDTDEGDPFGRPVIERFGAANEMRATLYGGFLEALDMILHPNIFIPATSPVQAWQLTARDGQPVPIMSKEDIPTWEEAPEIPMSLPAIIKNLDHDMDSAAGLMETAQGTEVSTSQSGIAKEVAVRQSLQALGQIFDNRDAGTRRYWRIKCQLAQKALTAPQRIAYEGEDGAWSEDWFTGADFTGVRDVDVMPGTGTGMTPQAKQQYVAAMQDKGWITPDAAAELMQGTVTNDLGLPPDEHKQHIERQVTAWLKGPSPTWMQQYTAFVQAQQQNQQLQQRWQQAAALAQQQGLAAPPPPQPMPVTPPWTPFEQRPNDEEPMVAKVRHARLTRLISSTKYAKATPQWRWLVDTEYQRMAYAASVVTVRQQAGQIQLPKGVSIQMKGNEQNVGPEELAAINPKQPQPAQSAQPQQQAA